MNEAPQTENREKKKRTAWQKKYLGRKGESYSKLVGENGSRGR